MILSAEHLITRIKNLDADDFWPPQHILAPKLYTVSPSEWSRCVLPTAKQKVVEFTAETLYYAGVDLEVDTDVLSGIAGYVNRVFLISGYITFMNSTQTSTYMGNAGRPNGRIVCFHPTLLRRRKLLSARSA
jgi:hypothetical protein